MQIKPNTAKKHLRNGHATIESVTSQNGVRYYVLHNDKYDRVDYVDADGFDELPNVTQYTQDHGPYVARIVLWAGTMEQEFYADSYNQALKIVDEYHRNSSSPTYFSEDGEQMFDNGQYFETESGVGIA